MGMKHENERNMRTKSPFLTSQLTTVTSPVTPRVNQYVSSCCVLLLLFLNHFCTCLSLSLLSSPLLSSPLSLEATEAIIEKMLLDKNFIRCKEKSVTREGTLAPIMLCFHRCANANTYHHWSLPFTATRCTNRTSPRTRTSSHKEGRRGRDMAAAVDAQSNRATLPSKPKQVLLTNDDGPESPFFYPFAEGLRNTLDWNTYVCIPDSNWSYVSKSLKPPKTKFQVQRKAQDEARVPISPASCVNLGLYQVSAYTYTGKGGKNDVHCSSVSFLFFNLNTTHCNEWIGFKMD